MINDAAHIKRIKVVSNTHWDREFRRSFEKTRRALITMMNTTLDILENDPDYHSFTMDGHSVMIDDYLEMMPERTEQVEKFIRQGRLVIGPYYTLAEQFSIAQEPLIRNLLWGRKTIEKYGGKPGTVAYTPSSWGQTGQLPQILSHFGLSKMMFYRGISHHESDAEYVWSAPDGTKVLASRFALYARYNWYYQVHRAVTRGKVFDKDYTWGKYNEIPFRIADSMSGEAQSFDLKDPALHYEKANLKQSIEDMVQREGAHFTTDIFLAMHGHDISVAHPLESRIIRDAQEIFKGKYEIEHTSLEEYWVELEKALDVAHLPVLTGERRAYLKKGMWTFLFPATISTRTYLKQQDFAATNKLVYSAEPLASLAVALGDRYPKRYLDRGWKYLLSNHTHDANGGCAPDAVCKDMEYRYRKASDIGDIVSEDAMAYIAKNLSPDGQAQNAVQLIVYNPLPFERDAVAELDVEMPRGMGAKSVALKNDADRDVKCQGILSEKSSAFVDSIWDVPTILESNHIKQYASLTKLPPLGYRVYALEPAGDELRQKDSLITGPNSMENAFLKVYVRGNGSADVVNKKTGKTFKGLNYLSDQGECGNAWKHVSPVYDRNYNSLGAAACVSVVESGPLVSRIAAEYKFPVPADYADGTARSNVMKNLPVRIVYTLKKDSNLLEVALEVDNTAKDHWLRANFPTGIKTDVTWADSHFDVVSRAIRIPDSRGWVEEALGTHPLRTFVDRNDAKDGLAVLPKGIFEYEAFEDENSTLALTLIRACRIKLAVSEEKVTELSDTGIQCPGKQSFEYALCIHEGGWESAQILSRAAEYNAPVRCAMSGPGKGVLPQEASLFALCSPDLSVSCVKQCEDGCGLIIRLFNPLSAARNAELRFGPKIKSAAVCRMDEAVTEEVPVEKNGLCYRVGAKKIVTFKVELGE